LCRDSLGFAVAISFTFFGLAQTAHDNKQKALELRLQTDVVWKNIPESFIVQIAYGIRLQREGF